MANPLTVVGSPTFGAAKFGNGLTAVSDTNYLAIPNAAGAPLSAATSSFTVEAWIKTSDSTNTQLIAAFGTLASPNNLALLYVAAGQFNAYFTGATSGGGVSCNSGVTVSDGAWHHVAAVVTGGASITTFVDGVKCTTSSITYSGLTGGSGGYLGRHFPTGNQFNGSIDEFAVWPTARYTATFTLPASAYTGNEGMSSLYHLQADGTDSAAPPAANIIDPTNSAIIFSPFNWAIDAGSAKAVNAGAYLRTFFTGTSIALNFNTASDVSPYPEFWARIDNQGWTKYQLSAGNPSIVIGTGLVSRKHLVEVVVKSFTTPPGDWADPPAMLFNLTGILLDAGATVSQPNRRTKSVLIYGDSISAGHLTLGLAPGSEIEDNDSLGSWAYAMTTVLDAEVGVVAFGGTGISASGDGGVPPLPSSYNFVYAGHARSFSSPAPDLIVFNEGTNDGTNNIVSAYAGVVNALLSAAPAAKQILLVPFGSSFAANQRANIIATVAAVNDPRVTWVDSGGWLNNADTVDGTHPYGYAGVGLLAPMVAPYLLAALYPIGTGGKHYDFE